ncbi:FimB/Mfa2 family fimbrial subunit [Dysgonomonas sp. ZJ709]|uniref:FimB/Mfa2 family fimbrial subunit n=1 Tax=Dysgonomonas sp. ZJ709 TaxID=2709797 RepID=UPI0013E9FC0D|nr:FimB/Mfa2 family fimbrial subunit [Dysgonomonas sp. ZJ709]
MRYPFSTTTRKALLSLILIFLFWGCIDKDYDDCPTGLGLSLSFVYTHNTAYKDLFADQVETLDLFIYDEDNNFFVAKHILSADLDIGNSYSLSFLPVGNYTIVIWGNMDALRFNNTYTSMLADMQVSIITDHQRLVTSGKYSLFHGLAKIRATDNGIQTISLIKNTNDIHIIIEDDPATGGTKNIKEPYTVQLDGFNGDYNYDNSLAGNAKLQHISACTMTHDQAQQTDFTVMRFFKEGNMQITLKNASGEVLYEESLTQRILQNLPINTQEDLDRLDDYTFHYRVSNENGTNSFALISINNWQVINSPSGM